MAGVPLVVNAKLNKDVSVTLHGENHGNIDQSYYESLKFTKSAVLLVEHSTNACEIKPEHEEAFRRYAKGSEWIFYTQKKLNNPNVVCFDTRAEQGYLNAFQEKELRMIANKMHEADMANVRTLLDGVLKSMKTFTENQDYYSQLPGYYERSYDLLDGQVKALVSLVRYKKSKGTKEVLGMPIDDLLNGLASTLIDNIVKIGSVSADLSLLKALDIFSKSTSDIHVFCGKNHVIRMLRMANLSDVTVKLGSLTQSLMESSIIDLDGDSAMDRKLAELK